MSSTAATPEETRKARNKKKKEKQKLKKKQAPQDQASTQSQGKPKDKPKDKPQDKPEKLVDGASTEKKKKKKKKKPATEGKEKEKEKEKEKPAEKEKDSTKKTDSKEKGKNTGKSKEIQPKEKVDPKGGKPKEKKEPTKEKVEPEAVGPTEKKKNIIPNVVPKMDPKEQAKLQAMFGNMQKQNARFYIDEKGKDTTLEKAETEATTEDGGVDLKQIPSVYIKNCKDSKYTFNGRVTKLLIEGCENVTVTVNSNILTNTLELWKSKTMTVKVSHEVRTLQLDMLSDSKIEFDRAEGLGQIIWNQLENCNLIFADKSKHNRQIGFNEMKKKYPDSNLITDQFIVRFIEDELLEERCIRLKNGYLSTEREAIDWDKRNILKRDEYMNKFLKEAGITLNKVDKKDEPGPNDKCNCGSGKKFKKCCQGKKKVTGVTTDLTFKA